MNSFDDFDIDWNDWMENWFVSHNNPDNRCKIVENAIVTVFKTKDGRFKGVYNDHFTHCAYKTRDEAKIASERLVKHYPAKKCDWDDFKS